VRGVYTHDGDGVLDGRFWHASPDTYERLVGVEGVRARMLETHIKHAVAVVGVNAAHSEGVSDDNVA